VRVEDRSKDIAAPITNAPTPEGKAIGEVAAVEAAAPPTPFSFDEANAWKPAMSRTVIYTLVTLVNA
jgi:hypothetical protein